MKLYELTFLISPTLLQEEIKAFQEKVGLLIKDEQGIDLEFKNAVETRLSHPIDKNTQAWLVSLEFSSTPESILLIEKKLKKEEQILRFLIVNKKKVEPIPFSRKPLIKKEVDSEKADSEKTDSEKADSEEKEKVELKDIEKKLEEILKD